MGGGGGGRRQAAGPAPQANRRHRHEHQQCILRYAHTREKVCLYSSARETASRQSSLAPGLCAGRPCRRRAPINWQNLREHEARGGAEPRGGKWENIPDHARDMYCTDAWGGRRRGGAAELDAAPRLCSDSHLWACAGRARRWGGLARIGPAPGRTAPEQRGLSLQGRSCRCGTQESPARGALPPPLLAPSTPSSRVRWAAKDAAGRDRGRRQVGVERARAVGQTRRRSRTGKQGGCRMRVMHPPHLPVVGYPAGRAPPATPPTPMRLPPSSTVYPPKPPACPPHVPPQ